MNKERMLKLADYIEGLPAFMFVMTRWYKEHKCGTIGCIAGHAVALFGNGDVRAMARTYPVSETFNLASDLLGLDKKDAKHLFYAEWARPKLIEDVTQYEAAARLREMANG